MNSDGDKSDSEKVNGFMSDPDGGFEGGAAAGAASTAGSAGTTVTKAVA